MSGAVQTGQWGEYLTIAQMICEGIEVYRTVCDDQHVDCIVRVGPGRYRPVQIKARRADVDQPDRIANVKLPDLGQFPCAFLVAYLQLNGKWYIIPVEKKAELGSQNQNGANAGSWTFVVLNPNGTAKPQFQGFENNWGPLVLSA